MHHPLTDIEVEFEINWPVRYQITAKRSYFHRRTDGQTSRTTTKASLKKKRKKIHFSHLSERHGHLKVKRFWKKRPDKPWVGFEMFSHTLIIYSCINSIACRLSVEVHTYYIIRQSIIKQNPFLPLHIYNHY